ncbi:MAG: hypothetical protein KF781_06940 [Chitinophagaceae bacterium]|nr:hypothetical protein [Chitinophagaceae bacterium]MCW5904042.1 hypothetical protein [Chitinophagaceae bacterium]
MNFIPYGKQHISDEDLFAITEALKSNFLTQVPQIIGAQDLEPAFHDAGQFYFFSVKDFLRDNKLFTDHTVGIEMPESEVQDIDTIEDWKIAELKYSIMQKHQEFL